MLIHFNNADQASSKSSEDLRNFLNDWSEFVSNKPKVAKKYNVSMVGYKRISHLRGKYIHSHKGKCLRRHVIKTFSFVKIREVGAAYPTDVTADFNPSVTPTGDDHGQQGKVDVTMDYNGSTP